MNDVLLSVWNRFFSSEQLAGFARAGLDVHWIGNARPPSNVSRRSFKALSWALLRAHFLTGHRALSEWSMNAFQYSAAMTRWNAKVVWAYVELNMPLLRQARKRGVPTVLDVPIGHQRTYTEILAAEHRAYGGPAPRKWDETWARLCEEQYAAADWLSVGSHFVRQTLEERGIPGTKILVNSYGVDAGRWIRCGENGRRYDGKLVFVFTASFTLRKGIHYLLKAWKQATLPDAELWVCGGGPLDLHRVAGGLPGSVKLLGYLNHDALASTYEQAHVFVLPSLFEGLVRSGLEAMAAGLPLIITRETGLGDFVEDGKEGWFVPSRNVDALVERLRWCYDHRDAVRTAAQHAFQRGKDLTFESYGDRCAAIVRCLIEGRLPTEALG